MWLGRHGKEYSQFKPELADFQVFKFTCLSSIFVRLSIFRICIREYVNKWDSYLDFDFIHTKEDKTVKIGKIRYIQLWSSRLFITHKPLQPVKLDNMNNQQYHTYLWEFENYINTFYWGNKTWPQKIFFLGFLLNLLNESLHSSFSKFRLDSHDGTNSRDSFVSWDSPDIPASSDSLDR